MCPGLRGLMRFVPFVSIMICSRNAAHGNRLSFHRFYLMLLPSLLADFIAL